MGPIATEKPLSTEECACNLVCLCSKRDCSCIFRNYCKGCEREQYDCDDDDDDDDTYSQFSGYFHADGIVKKLENVEDGWEWWNFDNKDYDEVTLVFTVSYSKLFKFFNSSLISFRFLVQIQIQGTKGPLPKLVRGLLRRSMLQYVHHHLL
jgi:hypothetical protein